MPFIGVFGADQTSKAAFLNSVSKKNESEGMAIYHRDASGRRFLFLDDQRYPEKIQGYARIASISDHAYYIFPKYAKMTPPDGELAMLLQSFRLRGSVVVLDGGASAEDVVSVFRGTSLSGFSVDHRSASSSVMDLSVVEESGSFPRDGTLIHVDRTFNVKGVGTVALGFVLSGRVSVHDDLRTIPHPAGKTVEVRGIQINDEDVESAGRGCRVGLSLRGADAAELGRTAWLDDGSCRLGDSLAFQFEPCPYYRQGIDGRDLHLQVPGETVTSKVSSAGRGFLARLPHPVPVWQGMRVAVLDLNGKSLRVAGGGLCMEGAQADG
ncbi:MAG: hypothetical protein JRN39_08010 [Nitrososphaerota archaeon]|nr:hypothetical protein [Nitrososphaerota archaeon]